MKHISAFDCSFRALDGELKKKMETGYSNAVDYFH